MNPHCRLCSLIRNTPPASAPRFLRGALFHLQIPPGPGRKGAPPPTYVFYFPFLSVAAMSTSPHETNLCSMLPHHFLLHAKSLRGPTLRAPLSQRQAFVPSLLRYKSFHLTTDPVEVSLHFNGHVSPQFRDTHDASGFLDGRCWAHRVEKTHPFRQLKVHPNLDI